MTSEPCSFVSHLECSATGEHYEAGRLHALSRSGKPLLVRYRLDEIERAFPREALRERAWSMWRYRELLPLPRAAEVVSLGETVTPIVAAPRVARAAGGGELLIKQEGMLPTGSFKARGQAVAISMARALGVKAAVIPTAGNAGAAMAAYCSRAGIESHVLCPDDTPQTIVRQAALQGASVYLVNGLLDECGKLAGALARERGWFDLSTLKEPYRIEGKKTMGFELAEQLGWELPDVIFYPTGGGTGYIGMWKAFDEMESLGWIGRKRPRMVCVQSSGCAPLVRAWREGQSHARRWDEVETYASGFKAPATIGDFLVLDILRASEGFGITVSDEEIVAAQLDMGRAEGILLCPEGAGCFAAWRKAIAAGQLRGDERTLVFDTASGLKYPMPAAGIAVDKSVGLASA
ncbi:MAG: threonine synthase [Burkholderiales bacterium]|nr:threonine synthase [Burkholderiales bacterium]